MLTPREVGQAGSPEGALFKRPRPRSGRIPESKRPPLQYRLWYLNEEGYCVLVVQLDRATYLEKGQRRIFFLNKLRLQNTESKV